MWTNLLIGLLLVVHFLVGVFLIVIILMQRTKEGGLGAAFGAGMTDSLFGASSANVLTKITVWCAGIFFVTSLSMAVLFSHRPKEKSLVDKTLRQTTTQPLGGQETPATPQSPETPQVPATPAPEQGGTGSQQQTPTPPPAPESQPAPAPVTPPSTQPQEPKTSP